MLFSQNGWFLLAVWTGPSVPWEWWVAGWQYVSCPTWHHPSPPQSNTQPLPSLRFSRQREDWEPWPQARQINSLIIKILSPSVPTSVWIVYSHFIAFFADKSLYVEQCDNINIETGLYLLAVLSKHLATLSCYYQIKCRNHFMIKLSLTNHE